MEKENSHLRKNPFEIPKGYFEEQEIAFNKRFIENTPKVVSRNLNWFKSVAAVLILMVVAGIGYITNLNNPSPADLVLTDEESLEYLLNNEGIEELLIDNSFEIPELEFAEIDIESLAEYLENEFDRNELLIIEN